MRLDDTTVVVTGASAGLGRVMAAAFVAEGADVAFSSRSEERLTAAIEGIPEEERAGEAAAVPADVRSREAVERLFDRTEELFGGVDVLVNNAGIHQLHVTPDHQRHPVEEIPVDAWDAILETNLRGAFLCSKAVLPGMRDRGAGRLVHLSSGHGIAGRARRAAYVSSKFGLEGLHETLALELEESGVDSVAFRPPGGGVYTERAEEYGRTRDSFTHPDPEVVAEPAVQLAAGAGENGGRYVATADGEGLEAYTRTDR